MADLIQNRHLLRRLYDAGACLTRCCDIALLASEDDRAQASQHGAQLAAAIEELRQVLQEVAGPPHCTEAGRCSSRLLCLPDDLITQLARLAGKECRAVCTRLRDAYGHLGLTVRQPRADFQVPTSAARVRRSYSPSIAALRAELLASLQAQCRQQLSLAGLHACVQRCPTWAAQVSRLELSDALVPEAGALHLLRQSLPALRHLTLANVQEGGAGELPRFEGVTHLGLLCSQDTFVRAYYQPAATFSLLTLAPSVCSLHLDLRFLRLAGHRLRDALQPLARLTHLELVSAVDNDQHLNKDWAYEGEVCDVLVSLGDQLQSLAFLTPQYDMRWDLNEVVLPALTRLTSLGWCIGWGAKNAYVEEVDWLRVGSLRQLVLGHSPTERQDRSCPRDVARLGLLPDESQDHRIPADALGLLADGCEDGAGVAASALHTLALPTVSNLYTQVRDEDREADDEAAQEAVAAAGHLLRLLGTVADRCPGLTSLQCGADLNVHHRLLGGLPMHAPGHWLQPAGGLLRLRQLVLTISGYELDALAHLSRCSVLSALWLSVENSHLLGERCSQDAEYDPGSGLQLLTTLQHLAVRDCDGGYNTSGAGCALVLAAVTLPQLRVLDMVHAPVFNYHCKEAWGPSGQAPSCLRQVRISSHQCLQLLHDPEQQQQQQQEEKRFRGVLASRLPSQAMVTELAVTMYDKHQEGSLWGPAPLSLADLIVE